MAKARDDYAAVQEMIDRYNRVFETYARADVATQWRAQSVMRQALDEYNNLRLQQQTNTLRIYEAQRDVDRSQKISPVTQPVVNDKYWQGANVATIAQNNMVPPLVQPTETTEVSPASGVQPIAQVTPATTTSPLGEVPTTVSTRRTVPTWVTNIINSQTPKYPGTTISPVTPTYTVPWASYGAGSVATMPSAQKYTNAQTSGSYPASRVWRRFPTRSGFTSRFNR